MLRLTRIDEVEVLELPPNVFRVSDIIAEDLDKLPSIIMPGTYDPMHDGHVAAKKRAEDLLGKPVAIMLVENAYKEEKLFTLYERIFFVQERFPGETIFIAPSAEEITISHREASVIVRKLRPQPDKKNPLLKADTAEYYDICDTYDIDRSKMLEIPIGDISSQTLKIDAVIAGKFDAKPAGISQAAFDALLSKYDHLRPEN